MLLFELIVARLPRIRAHISPPVWNSINAEEFRSEHIAWSLPGPYISQGRYRTEVPREYTNAKELLSSNVPAPAELRAARAPVAGGQLAGVGGKGLLEPRIRFVYCQVFSNGVPHSSGSCRKNRHGFSCTQSTEFWEGFPETLSLGQSGPGVFHGRSHKYR